MEHSFYCLMNRRRFFLTMFFHGMVLSCISSNMAFAAPPTFSNESDRLSLLEFKNRVTQDPLQIMNSWNESTHFCNWLGITCTPSNQSVMTLNLNSQNLVGSIPPSIGNLTHLTGINLQNNSFHGQLPQELGRLFRLRDLNLTNNSFSGKIPSNLSLCTKLRVLDLRGNDLVGQIPNQLNSLMQLEFLGLRSKHLTGNIPAWIGNFSSLQTLSLSESSLQGSIPHELGRLSQLKFFQLYANNLSGIVPPSLYNISSIYYFNVVQNQLHGQLPPDVGLTLPNLEEFASDLNNFTGPLPVSLPNASRLAIFDVSHNSLTGAVPVNLGSLRSLYFFNVEDNMLGSGEIGDLNFLDFLVNCTSLKFLGLRGNHIGGEFPSSIANLSTNLRGLSMGVNMIFGSIPSGIGNLVELRLLGLESNNLNGIVPDSIGKLQKLEGLALNTNKFSGPIPSSFGNLTRLTILYLEDNSFEGNIPPSLGNCQNLLVLSFYINNLNGSIPKQVIGISSLSIYVDLSYNSLTGSLPLEVGNLKQLVDFDVSENKLSGEIPSTFGSCYSLERLRLAGNSFQGSIPQSLISLKGIGNIDLSRNNLSGKIPEFLGKFLFLKHLNLSFNDFEGQVPMEGVFANATAVSILGNDKLCGGIPELLLRSCFRKKTEHQHLSLKIVIPVTCAVIIVAFLLCLFTICIVRKRSRKGPLYTSFSKDRQLGVSYLELFRATNGFSEENLIGSGSFGSVYKGNLFETILAIKVLNLQQRGASKSFIDECEVLRSTRHRNLLKVTTACSSVDQQGNEFKALVLEFMSNGSLEQRLHPRTDQEQDGIKRLNVIERLNIAIDVASALDYLHHDCQTPIVHCDLKPSNVLLDDDLVAHVCDFGLAKFLFDSSRTMTAGLKGSVGYIPPEYGTGGHVSLLGDIYSYGILLLEMFTGKRPTDDMFKDGLNIHKFVSTAFPEHIMDIVDSSLLFDEEEDNDDEDESGRKYQIEERSIIKEEDPQANTRVKLEECLVSIMSIGLACSATSPSDRIPMNAVVRTMSAIRDSFH